MKVEVAIEEMPAWASPNWPFGREFCTLIIAEKISQSPGTYDDFVCNAILNKVRSLYFWGPEADKAADWAVFAISARLKVHEERLKHEYLITVPFLGKTIDEALDLILTAWMPNSVEDMEGALLMVCGLSGLQSMGEVRRTLQHMREGSDLCR